MDFGLAKKSGAAPLAAAPTEMTAGQAKLTVEGTIIGTFQYMVNNCTTATSATQAGHPPRAQNLPGTADPKLPPV